MYIQNCIITQQAFDIAYRMEVPHRQKKLNWFLNLVTQNCALL